MQEEVETSVYDTAAGNVWTSFSILICECINNQSGTCYNFIF